MLVEEKKIKFAVVGYGHIGKRHSEMIMRNAESELVAIVDIKNENELGVLPQGIPFYKSIEQLLSSKNEIDVVNICTPNGLHAEHAIKSLNSFKNVVLEKPVSLNKSDAERIIFKALQVNKQVFSVMQNRYSPPSVWIKELVTSGKLGKIFMVQLNCYWNRDNRYYKAGSWHGNLILDGGTLFTQFSHFIDILYWLFGDIENIKSRIRDFNHQDLTDFEDSGFINFDFKEGGG